MSDSASKHVWVASRYQLIRRLGEGGMGVVYLARDALQKKEGKRKSLVALKFLPRQSDPVRIKMFKQEFQMLTKLKHPYLCQVFDFGFDRQRQQYFFTSEYLRGKDILTATRGWAPAKVFALLTQLCEVLAYIHDHGVIHNDLKPSNIWVVGGQVKVLDFGVSSFLHAASLPAAGGTRGYQAPEVPLRGKGTVASDLFSLGVVLSHLLPEKQRGHRAVETLVTQLTERLPQNRPRNVRQVLAALSSLAKTGPKEFPTSMDTFLEVPFVGRGREIEQLLDFVRQPPSSISPRILELHGEKGAGKTRLLREFLVELQLQGIGHAYGDCGDAEMPYSPWPRIFQHLKMFVGEEHHLDTLELENLLLGRPSSGDQLLREVQNPLMDELPADERMRLFYRFGSFLEALCADNRIVILIDNLDQAQPESLRLIQYLTRLPLGNCCFVSSRLQGEGQGPRIELRPLHAREVEKAAQAALGGCNIPRLWLQEMIRFSHGNPALVLTCLARWRERHWIVAQSGTWKFTSAKPKKLHDPYLPSARFGLQLGGISAKDKAMLNACSLFSQAFSAEDLHILYRRPLPLLKRFLSDQVQRGTLKAPDEGMFRWVQEDLRQWCYEKLLDSAATKRKVESEHKRLGEYFVKRYKANPGEQELAAASWHYARAHDRLSAGRCNLMLGNLYFSRLALWQAEDAYQQALRYRKALSRKDYMTLRENLVDLYFAQGQGERGLPLLKELLDEEGIPPQHRAFHLLKLVVIYRNQGAIHRASEQAQAAMALLGEQEQPILFARLLAQFAQCEARLGRTAGTFAYLEKALQLVDRKQDPEAYAVLCNIRGSFLMEYANELDRALLEFQNAEKIYSRLRNPRRLAVVHHNLGIVYGRKGLFAKERAAYQEALAYARESGDIRRLLHNLKSLGSFYFRTGDFERAEQSYEEALSLARVVEEPVLEAKILLHLGQVSHFRASYKRGQGCFTQALEQVSALENPETCKYELLSWYTFLLSLGQWEKADQALQQVLTWKGQKEDALFEGFIPLFEGEGLSHQGLYEESQERLRAAVACFEKARQPAFVSEARCLMVHTDLLAQRPLDPHAEKTIHQAIAGFDQQHSIFQALRARLIWLKACIQRDSTPEAALKIARTAAKQHANLLSAAPEFAVEFQILLSQAHAKASQWSEALACLEKVKQILGKIEANLAPENQPSYRRALLSREVSRVEDVFANHSHAFFRDWRDLTREYREILEGLERGRLLAESAFSLAKFLSQLLEQSLALTGAKRGVVFLRHEKEFRENLSCTKGTGKSWDISAKLRKWLQAKMTGSTESEIQPIDKISIHPLQADQEIWGYLVLEEGGLLEENEAFQDLWRDACAFGEHLCQMEGMRKEVERSTSSLTQQRLTQWQNQVLSANVWKMGPMVGGRSREMAKAFLLATRISPTSVTVLLEGETGTGKELLARFIHEAGQMDLKITKPFVTVQCSTLSPELWESHLFGHLEGTFTGAIRDQEGMLTQADGGTLFLDDVSVIPLEIQAKILQVLETGEYRPLGSQMVRKFRCRVIATTTRNLQEMIQGGAFREDLYFRLHVVHIVLPPLRDRREDIPYLVDHLLERISMESGKKKKVISEAALCVLYYAWWPGNVRQLENCLRQLEVAVTRQRIEVEDLPRDIREGTMEFPSWRMTDVKRQFMKEYLSNLLKYTKGNVSQAARLAKIPRPHLHVQMKRFLDRSYGES